MATNTSSFYVNKWSNLPIYINPQIDNDESAMVIHVSKITKKAYVSCEDFDATVNFKNDTFVPSIYYGFFPKEVDHNDIDTAFKILWIDIIKPKII